MPIKKRIVLCCDGTWNRPDELQAGKPAATNVFKLASAIAREGTDGVPQIVHYSVGVGSEGNIIDHVVGGAFGEGIDRIIEDGYRFLALNYADGDEIWLFGFSRGAYVARSTAGLIRKAGIVRPELLELSADALELYRSEDAQPDGPRAVAFRGANARESDIHFIGVWDTVGALGIPQHLLPLFEPSIKVINARVSKYQFHDDKLSSHVRNAFHALAIDEHRQPFLPTLWQAQEDAVDQTLEQVWFAGSHSDVGGGYPEHGLSDLALGWMIEKAKSRGLAVGAVPGMAANARGELHDSMTPFFRFLGSANRAIQPGVAGQAIDPSVAMRIDEIPGYRPTNLP